MFLSGIKRILRSVPASLIACAVFLLPVESALAVANLSLSTSFVPVDSARNTPAVAVPYMDTAGTWNGSFEATNTSGDRFTLRVQNISGTDALDIDIDADLPNGFRLPSGSFPLTVTSPNGCNTTSGSTRFTGISVTQFGNQINYNIPNNRNIPVGCIYDFRIGLTTNDTVPFATAGLKNINFDFSYDDGGPGLLEEITHQVQVNGSTLSLLKTATTITAVDGDPVSFNIAITNSGSAGLFDLDFTDILGLNLSGIQIDVSAPYTDPPFGQDTFAFKGYFTPGETVNFVVDSTTNVVPDDTSCSIQNTGSVIDRAGQVTASGFDSIPYDLSNVLTLTHDLVNSYCLLCGQGEVILRVANTGGITLNNVTVADDLSSGLVLPSGLTYVANSVSFTVVTGPGSIAPFEPTLSGPNNSVVSWNIGSLDSPSDGTPSNPVVVDIRFLVERAVGFTQEALADPAATDRSIEATATYTSVCGANPAIITSSVGTLLLRQPEPVVTKLGWNVDAAQTEATAAAFVYGQEDDDIIWRIDIRNNGAANLEDLLVADTIGGNFEFTAVCTNVADAITMSGGPLSAVPPALPYNSCVARGPSAAPPFLPPPNPGVDVTAATNGYIYYVGRILASCSNATNTANIEWGCDVDGTDGGINETNSSIPAANLTGSAGLNTDVSGGDLDGGVSNQLAVVVQITGTHPTNFGATAQPAGSRGRVTVTITNDTGGTVRDITFDDVLPADYVVDPSINNAGPNVNPATTATNNPAFDITVTPANGVASYRGMVDTVEWTNPNADPLLNTSPNFELRSSLAGAGAFQDNLLRHGDVVTISFDIVLINSARYDLVADLDTANPAPRNETNPTDPDNGETASIASPPGSGGPGFQITNNLTVDYFEACAVSDTLQEVRNNNFRAFPEDLDVDIAGVELSFIINTDPAINLPVTVETRNNGGHDARNYFLLVTFGNAMEVDPGVAITTTPGGGSCTDISGSLPTLPRPYWNFPVPIPVDDSPSVYQCDLGVIAPGAQVDINFELQRNTSSTVDDLTFRVDVVGEIQLSDGTPLTFPPVATSPGSQIDNVANNYSLDAIRARVIGFGLLKDIVGDCTEAASYPLRSPDAVFIGEDCQFNIISGGWFGFATPGFGIIAVHNIEVFDELPTAATPVNPSAQGFISHTNGAASDAEILNSGIVFSPAPIAQLDQGTVSWTFNVPNGGVSPNDNKLYVRDKLFRTDITSRILNDQVDPVDPSVATPNRHDILSRNILNTTFNADFSGGVFSFGPGTTGYPAESLRRYDLTITEPNIVITKDVCNETLAGGACADTDFVDFVNTGDTEDFYVYRIKIENIDDSGVTGVTRSPAYNMVLTDTLDSSDLMQVHPVEDPQTLDPLRYPFNNDGLDNDGDGTIDALDLNGEGEILTDNLVNIALVNPAVIKFSYTESTVLEQINPGDPAIYLYYRVDPDDFIAPLQILTNTVDVKYDSLEGLHGSQNPQVYDTDPDTNLNGTIGSARVYTNAGETARVQILPLEVEPKIIVQTATQPGVGPLADLTGVVVGEEIEYKLSTLIPVANLREFAVRDELPPGIACVDVPDVDLGPTGPHAAAGFSPGGLFTIANGGITCTNNLVEYNFGDQELTSGPANTRYRFEVSFIARVENTPTTNITPFNPGVNNCIIRNGGAATSWGVAPPSSACNLDTFVRTSYRNDPSQGSVLIEHLFDPVQVTVREPQLQITKTFIAAGSGNPGTDETAGDAQDLFDVRVDVTNVGDAAAFNPQILDNLLNTKFTYRGFVGGADAPSSDGGITLPLAPVPTGAPGTNQPIFSWPVNYTIAAGGSISFIYRVQSNGDVGPLENVANTIDAKWTSLEDTTVALNRTGFIAADGAVLGMRNGYFPGIDSVPANINNDYIYTNNDAIDVPGLTVTKTDLDRQIDPTDITSTIGEHRRFQIDIELPEGTTTNVRLDDNLAFADLAPAPIQTYLLENLAPFAVQYEFFGITSINGTAPTPANAETIFTSVPADETANLASWNIGTVVTEAEDDSPLNLTAVINPRIRIIYYARLNNDLATNNGDDLANQVSLQYTSGLVPSTTETVTAETLPVEVTEPVLLVSKVADVATADAGDVIQYTVTISHDPTSTAEAFDVNIVDILPASVTFTSAVSLQVNGSATGTAAPTISGQQLTWGRNNAGDDTLDIPLGESLILVYTVTVQNLVQPFEVIENSVVVDWTSMDGDITGLERIGIAGADCSASVAPDDYCVGPTIATVNVVDTNTIVKTKTSDSFNLTPAGTDVRIGDIIEYTLTLTLQEGTTRGLTLVDTLSNGLKFVDIVSVNGDVAAPYSSANGFIHAPITAPAVTTSGTNDILTWTIGDATSGIINSANDAVNDFVIVYRAVVTKDEFSLPQTATTAINNTLVLDYLDVNDAPTSGTSAPPLSRLTSTVNLDVQQPIIFTENILKDRYPSAIPSGSSVASNALIDFRLLACNVGTAPAYDVLLVDDLPVEMNQTTIANLDVDYTDSTGVTQLTQLVATTDYTYTPPAVDGGNMVFVFNNLANPLLPNQCIRVMFDINVDNPIGINFSWSNEFRVDDYFSLDADDLNAIVPERQDYVAAGPVFFNMNTVSPNNPPDKNLLSPINAIDGNHDEATIGELVTYQIIVPSDDDDPLVAPNPNPMTADLFRVRIQDTLPSHLAFVSATLDNSNPAWYSQPGPLTTTVGAGNVLGITLDPTLFLSASSGETQPAVINVTSRVVNVPTTNSSVAAFGNTASFWFTRAISDTSEVPGGADVTPPEDNLFIVEPQINLIAKAVTNLTQADADTNAGDILQYTLTFSTSGGAANDAFSDAFDVSIIDTLDAGLDYCSVAEDANCINPSSSIGTMETSRAAIISGTGTLADPHIISWNSVNATNTDIDVPEGTALVTITYTVKVMDSVLANQSINSSTVIGWSSLNGAFEPDERSYTATFVNGPGLTVPIVNDLTKSLNSSTSTLAGANDVRIGDVVDYELRISMQEATSETVILTDTLPQGLKYEGIVSINGDNDGTFEQVSPFIHPTYTQAVAVVAGDPALGASVVTWTLNDIVNTGNNITTDDDFVIIYRARVLDLVQTPLNDPQSNIALLNTVDLEYGTAPTGTRTSDLNNTLSISIDQPNITVNKLLDPVVPDSVIVANEVLTFTIDVSNNNVQSESIAYDLVLQDTLPLGLRNTTPVITGVEMPVGTSILPIIPLQSYDSATGIVTWDFDTVIANQLSIPAGETLRLRYQVQADNNIGTGVSISNAAQAVRYHSFDDGEVPAPVAAAPSISPAVAPVREIYGPSNISSVNLTTAGPGALLKTNQTDTLISIGETFTYTIKVPDVPVNTALHDVRILDNLALIPGVDLYFVSVTAIDDDGQPADEDDNFSPVNSSGSLTNLVIEDVTNGIEIPAGESISVQVTVILRNTPNNTGLPLPADTFANTADYTFNSIDNDTGSVGVGAPDTTGALTVVEPFLEIVKTGPAPNTVFFNTAIPYQLVVENTGTGPAFDTTITDVLPQVADNLPLTGGTCDVIPTNIHAQVFDNASVAIIGRPELTQNVDYTISYTAAPACEFVVTTLTSAAVLEITQKLIITYDTLLDQDSQNNALLTNTASVTEYFSQDTPAGVVIGEIRRYQNDAASTLDESSYTVQVAAAELVMTKVATDNVTAGGSGAFADPGDKLHYTIQVNNIGPAPTGTFSFTDEPDRLNPAPGYFNFASLSNVLLDGAVVPYTAAAGVLTIPNLSLTEAGGIKDSLTIEFNIDLIQVITAGTAVLNQGEAHLTGFSALPTDDPSIGGLTDPTETLIDAAPAFEVSKRSEDRTGETTVLRQGDILRYTLQVKNIGLENVTNAYLRDVIPANTHYVSGSTRLNGIAVADVNGTSALEYEMLINAPENTTPGFMRADPSPAVTSNIATITFDVTVDADVVDGTVISNQGYVGGLGAGSGPFAEQASNDPDTTLANDPTIDVVGNLPALNAQKVVSLFDDVTSNGIVDAGDTLEYQIVVANGGAVNATQVSLIDPIPANSSYVAASVTLNGTAIPDASLVSLAPLTLRLNSADLGLPNQAANDGQITAGNEATITFRVLVTGAAGNLISNQGTITSAQLPDLLTDADGNSGNGAQPTETYIGANSKLTLTKEVYVVGGGVALAGGTLEYVLQVENTGLVDATNIVLTDDIDGLDGAAIVSYQYGVTKLDGSTTYIGGAVTEPAGAANDLIVNYQLAKGVLEPGEKFTVSYRVDTDSTLAAGTLIFNTASVNWNESATSVTDTASIEIGGAPGVGVVGGDIWHDIIRAPVGTFTNGSDLKLQGWTVRIYLGNPASVLFAETLTDADGRYEFKGLPPSSAGGGDYELRFIPPGGTESSASMGLAVTGSRGTGSITGAGTAEQMSITGITVSQGVNIAHEDMPVIPAGVVYDAIIRTPVSGTTLNLVYNDGTNFVAVPDSCLPVNSNQRTQTTTTSGFYRFDIQPQAVGCTVTDFVIEVTSVPSNYSAGTSQIIPPGKAGNLQIDVPNCSGSSDDTILSNTDCDIQFAATPPGIDVPVRTDSTQAGVGGATQGTTYYLSKRVTTNGEVAFNNHIPVDPDQATSLAISKVSSMVNVTRSQLVPYTITLTNNLPVPLTDINLEDMFPAGFKYVAGSARIQVDNGPYIKTEPLHNAGTLTLTWDGLGIIGASSSVKIKLLLVVGSGVGEGEYINRAHARNVLTQGLASGEASATVRVVPDPTFDCSDIIGKVFDDKNLNAYQDDGEKGLAGVRVLTARGLEITTDAYGRFHLTCAVVPNPDRGSNFIIKLDERSLPTGYRLTTENPRVVRATRGKMVKFNFGAAIHRVVRLDMANEVFEPGTTEMRPQWLPRLDILISELAKDPSLLRLSYLADNETTGEVNDRLNVVKDEIQKRWEALNCCYQLTIETEVLWRKGGPPDRGGFND